jgi:excisionase family DNA binding protein
MNKTEAARFLEVSPRTLQRLTQQGKISVSYKHTKSGAAADFDEADLQQYKEQQETITYRPATAAQENLELAPRAAEALITRDNRLLALLEALQPPRKPIVATENKLTLSLIEAAALAGLSRLHLLEAIKSKKLKGRIIGKGWKIKKSDLEVYVQKL